MKESGLKALKIPVEKADQTRLGDDPEREKAVMFVHGWNSAIDAAMAVVLPLDELEAK